MADAKPSLLLIRTGRRELREYLLKPIAAEFRVHMISGDEPGWESLYIDGHTVVKRTLDTDSLLGAVRDLHAADPFDGVMTWQETHTPQIARVAEALGLPGGGVDAVARCRDKHQTREALDAAGVAQPRSVQVASVDEALEVADQIGYPVVIKPSDLAVSFGVILVASPDEMRAQYAVTSAIRVPGMPDYRVRVLIEEYADGPEISVDCAVVGGRVTVLCLAHKTTGFAPYFIETGHVVDAGDPLRDDPTLLGLLQSAHDAIGFRDGVTHVEARLTATGPKIIEINARLGGDLIPYLGLRATGVDVGVTAARIACGRPIDATPTLKLASGVRFFNTTRDKALITAIGFDLDRLPDTVADHVVLAEPGDRRPLATDNPVDARLAFATAVAPSLDEVDAALDRAEQALTVTTEESA